MKGRDATVRIHNYAANQMPTRRLTMAALYLAQIAYLSQQLIEQTKNVNNLIVRGKFELDLIQQTLRTLLIVCNELVIEKESDHEQK
jgi:hypothetical protein